MSIIDSSKFRIVYSVTSFADLAQFNSKSTQGTLGVVQATNSTSAQLYTYNVSDMTWYKANISASDVNALIAQFYAQNPIARPFLMTASATELVAGKLLFPVSTNAVTIENSDWLVTIVTALTINNKAPIPANAALQIGVLAPTQGGNPTFTAFINIPSYYLNQPMKLNNFSEGIDAPLSTQVIPANASCIIKIVNATLTDGSVEVSGNTYGN